jgi:hypothetical protein
LLWFEVFLLAAGLVLLGTFAAAQDRANHESGVHQLMARWDLTYRSLDAKALADLHPPEFEIVNRLGQWTASSVAEGEPMWAWTFSTSTRESRGGRALWNASASFALM